MADLQVISEISCRRERMREKIVINFFDDPREKSVESMASWFQNVFVTLKDLIVGGYICRENKRAQSIITKHQK